MQPAPGLWLFSCLCARLPEQPRPRSQPPPSPTRPRSHPALQDGATATQSRLGPCPQSLKSGIIVTNKAPGSTGVCSSTAQPKPSIKSVSGAGSALPKAGGAPDLPWLGKFWSTGAAQKPPTCVFQSPRDGLCVCFFFFFRGWMFLFIRGCLMCRLKPSPQRCCGAGGRGCARLAHPTRSSFMLHTRPCTAATTDGNPRSWARTPRQRIHGEGCCLLAAAPRAGGEAGAMDPASLPASFIRLESQD